ncbi:DUF2946 family protein [Nisaea nitritireducens]|uniref:DUF2946 family protein n=1 Tax=Nisaea nitritireducens TaxID=568392 RepID=UPI0018664B26|nr:DUF2946 family protein [Nisaea nitritireducens]
MRFLGVPHRAVLTRLLILSLTLQLLVPTVFASIQGGAGQRASDDPFRTAVICTAKGLVRISLDEQGNLVKNDDKEPSSAVTPDCIYCSLASSVLPSQAQQPGPAGLMPGTRCQTPLVDAELPRMAHHASSLQPRAPPRRQA